jgi:high affinity Mn2+ porin
VHGQTTVIMQGYPRMRSPYEGTNSLPGGGQGRETGTADAFLGWRLWQGGEFYFNPELAQGFGLNSTLGLAGFSNGEAQKGGATYPRFRPQRYTSARRSASAASRRRLRTARCSSRADATSTVSR